MTRARVLTGLPLLLVPIATIAVVPGLLRGETLFWGLPTLQFYPWRHFAFQELAAGRLPAWNPYVGAGAPLLANYQTAFFYPPNWLLLILPDAAAMSWTAVLHVIWAGLGMWLFARSLGLPPFGRGVATLAYALSGYILARLGSFPTADAAAWVPWIFWLTQRAVLRRALPDAAWLGLAFALQLLTGHAQTSWYSTLGAGLFALWLTVWAERGQPVRPRLRGLAVALAGFALGGAIAAVQLVPTAEYLRESQRSGGLDFATLTDLSYHPMRLIALLSPNFFGTPADGSYATEGIYFEDAATIGFIPVVGALAAVIGWWRTRRQAARPPAVAGVPFWTALALAALLIAFGKHTPFFRALVDSVPTFKDFREPVRWLILTVFGGAILAGVGVDCFWPRGPRTVFWSRLAGAGGAGMALMALAVLNWVDLDQEILRVLSWGLVVLGCWVAGAALLTLTQPVGATLSPAPISPLIWRSAVLLVITFELAWTATGLNPTVPAEFFEESAAPPPPGRIYWSEDQAYAVTFGEGDEDAAPVLGFFDVSDYRIARERWRDLRSSRLPNIPMLDRIATVNNNDPLQPRDHAAFVALIEELGVGAGPLLRAAAVTEVYGLQPIGWRGANPAVAPDADTVTDTWLAPSAVWVPSDAAVADALRDPAWDPRATAILVGRAPVTSEPAAASLQGTVQELPTAGFSERRFRVSSDRAAFLVVSQTWYPGWSATVDGSPAALLRANLAFQAVAVPAGDSEIVLRYRIRHWQAGALISALALLVTVIFLLGGAWRRHFRVPSH